MRKGFSLIELIIVIAISVMVSAIAITYSHVGQNQVSLSVEAAKISQFILQAKDLAIATYTGGAASCGFGVTFDYAAQTYSLFRYAPNGAPPCPTLASRVSVAAGEMKKYADQSWQTPISKGVQFQTVAGDVLQTVIFYPPAPTTLMSRNGAGGVFLAPTQTSKVYLVSADGGDTAVISVNPGGQIGF